MSKRFSIELDTVTEEQDNSPDSEVRDYLKQNGIEYEIINESGPAGGWPVIEYSSDSKTALENMVLEFWHDEDLLEFINESL